MRCSKSFFLLMIVLISLCHTGCENSPSEASSKSPATICTSSPYLQAAMNDLLGAGNQISSMLSLAGAGMCPGHMDLRPSQIQAVQKSKLFIRFDFQAGLDEKLFASVNSRPVIEAICVSNGLCNPESYLSVCEQISKILIKTKYYPKKIIENRLAEIRSRLLHLMDEIRGQISKSTIAKQPILTSPHQAKFCRFLGFNVLETFTNEENMSVKKIDQIVTQAREKKVALIVANAPEGRKMADVLASYLNARVVVLENFPSEQSAEAFDKMIRENIRRLTEK